MSGWHFHDIDLGRGRFLPVCELFSLGVGSFLGSGNGWRLLWFGVVAMGNAPYGWSEGGGSSSARPSSDGPSPGRVSRRVGVLEQARGVG
eukprot:11759087-Karenia_brevis.AAC.1